MTSHFPKSHLYLPEELPMMETNHTFASCSVWLKYKMEKHIATYDLFVRDMPPHRNFMLFGGLEEIIQELQQWRFTKDHITYLDGIGVLTPAMKRYLQSYRFHGTLSAMPEGTVFFPGEPIVRLTAPIIEASLFTLYFMNVVASHTTFLSKAARTVLAARGKIILGGGCRAQSIETNAKAVRALYLAGGGVPSSTAAICYKYKIPQPDGPTFFGQHTFIKSFAQEIDAMRAFAKVFPDQTAFMVDTYDIEQGIKKAITVAQELKANGHRLRYIVIDSGNLEQLSKRARRMLDAAGLEFVKIIVASNLDEYKVERLMLHKTPADVFIVITEFNTSSDAPKLEIVYKLAQLQDGKNIRYTAKLTPGKLSLPGEKQVFRTYDRRGHLLYDAIGLAHEKLGKQLLVPIFRAGKLVYEAPPLEKIRLYIQKQLALLPERLKEINKEYKYPVLISTTLEKLLKTIRKEKVGDTAQKQRDVYNV